MNHQQLAHRLCICIMQNMYIYRQKRAQSKAHAKKKKNQYNALVMGLCKESLPVRAIY